MTQKHTPGPWVWVKDKSDFGGTWLFADETPVLDYAGCGSHDTEISEANACLIAAAPDMLEALQGVMTFLEPMRFDRPSDDARAIELDRIMRTVIARATGCTQ